MGLLSNTNKVNEVADEFSSLNNRADNLVTQANSVIAALTSLKTEVENDTDNFTQEEVNEIDDVIVNFRSQLSNL
jgi:N-methylhydantoinase B/oxoprolinase/acetone carboxylase alpha subunit